MSRRDLLKYLDDFGWRDVDAAASFATKPAPAAEKQAPARAAAGGEDPLAAGDLAEMARRLADCRRCRLCQGRTQVVFGAGDPHADLLFVGEGPGEQEDLQGIPFVGRAGKLLTSLIEGIGFDRDAVYIANVVKCRPPGNRDPLPLEIESCRPYLEAQVEFIAPLVVVTLGNFATKLLLDTKEGITKLRGQKFPYRDGVLVPTLHPSAVLRNGGTALAQARADFVVAKRALTRT
jgi:DNA polymerase